MTNEPRRRPRKKVQPTAAKTDTPTRPERDPTMGRFLPGNGAAVTTGQRAVRAQLPAVFEALEADVRDFLEASITDDGGRKAIPTRRLSQHQYRAGLHRQILRLNAALSVHGLFDRRGKLRIAWLSKLESLMREARAFDQSLGLARRPKPVPNLDAYLAERYSGSATDGPRSGPSDQRQQ